MDLDAARTSASLGAGVDKVYMLSRDTIFSWVGYYLVLKCAMY